MEGGDREDDITERETEMNEAYDHCDGGGKGEEHSTEEEQMCSMKNILYSCYYC